MRNILILAALLVFLACEADAASPDPGSVAIEIEVIQNTEDGCTDCRCRLRGMLNQETPWNGWLSIGLINHDNIQSWSAVGNQVYCNSGPSESFLEKFNETVGIPFLVIDLLVSAIANPSDKSPTLELHLKQQKFEDFNASGNPVYSTSSNFRKFPSESSGRLTTTLLNSDKKTLEAFSLHEVVLDLTSTRLDQSKPAKYGSVAVTGDVPGAVVVLDGGFAGRIESGEPLVLDNVLTGKHTIQVRDFSGRKIEKKVKVRKGKTVEIEANVLPLKSSDQQLSIVSLGANPQDFSEYWRNKDGAIMVHVPSGPFLMGSPEGVGEKNEWPQHTVELPGFLIDKNEVTWRQYLKYVEDADAILPPAAVWGRLNNFPISFILYQEAATYCNWAGGRLPTEAEWEKAARGTDGRVYPWGDKWDATRCNSISGGMHRPEPVGNQPGCISPYGVLDMAGSVKEWTSDTYQKYPYDVAGSQSIQNTPARSYVMKGGGWMSQPQSIRSAYRHKRSPTSRLMDHGFRCVQDFEGEAP